MKRGCPTGNGSRDQTGRINFEGAWLFERELRQIIADAESELYPLTNTESMDYSDHRRDGKLLPEWADHAAKLKDRKRRAEDALRGFSRPDNSVRLPSGPAQRSKQRVDRNIGTYNEGRDPIGEFPAKQKRGMCNQTEINEGILIKQL